MKLPQIMELSRSHSDDFSQLAYSHEKDNDDEDDFVSSFQFRPARHVASQQPCVSTPQNFEASGDSSLISVIDRKMNQHFGNLLSAVEGFSARVSQLETRLHRVENSVDELKDSSGVNHGRTDGKLRQLENILREVECGMLDLRNKQEISEAQLQLAKLQMSKDHQKMENRASNAQTVSSQGVLPSAPQQSHQPPYSLPPNVPQTVPYQNLHPETWSQLPTQSPQNQIPSIQHADTNYSQPVLNPQPTPQMTYMSEVQQQPQPTTPYELFPPAPHLSLVSQLQQPPHVHPPVNAVGPQAQSSFVHNPGETPYMPSQSYPPSIHKTPNAPGLALPPQQQYPPPSQYTYDHSTSNRYPEFNPGHMQPAQHSSSDDFYSHTGPPSFSSAPKMKHSQVSPASGRSDGSSFSSLPTAMVLPHAIPMASAVDESSGSGGTGNRIPIDNVIDKVVAMGFRRDVVRATVRKMTENGQSVDLNVVLDKLMNDGEARPQSGGFGR